MMHRMSAPGRLIALFVATAATLAVASPLAAYAQDTDPQASTEVAVLQGLDKVTAQISTFDAPLNAVVKFGTLDIVARACKKRPPEEPPESAVFLEVTDIKPDEDPTPLFSGWMFASSPALSALEHPVYDVWVIDCKKALLAVPEGGG